MGGLMPSQRRGGASCLIGRCCAGEIGYVVDVLPMSSVLFALLWGGYQLAKARYGAAFDFAVAPVAAIHMSFVIEAN